MQDTIIAINGFSEQSLQKFSHSLTQSRYSSFLCSSHELNKVAALKIFWDTFHPVTRLHADILLSFIELGVKVNTMKYLKEREANLNGACGFCWPKQGDLCYFSKVPLYSQFIVERRKRKILGGIAIVISSGQLDYISVIYTEKQWFDTI